MRVLLFIALLGLSGAALSRDEANGCRAFPIPDGANVLYVASDMQVNGVPLSVKEMRTKDSPDAVLGFYRREWGRGKPGFFENPLQEWRTIATMDGPCYYTAQVRPDGKGTYALLGVSKRPAVKPRAPGAGFPMPAGSKVFNDLAHHDGPKNARTLLLTNQQPIEQNVRFYREQYEREGWSALVDRPVVTDRGPGYVMVWRRGLEEASITVQRQGASTTVVANLVDQP